MAYDVREQIYSRPLQFNVRLCAVGMRFNERGRNMPGPYSDNCITQDGDGHENVGLDGEEHKKSKGDDDGHKRILDERGASYNHLCCTKSGSCLTGEDICPDMKHEPQTTSASCSSYGSQHAVRDLQRPACAII